MFWGGGGSRDDAAAPNLRADNEKHLFAEGSTLTQASSCLSGTMGGFVHQELTAQIEWKSVRQIMSMVEGLKLNCTIRQGFGGRFLFAPSC